MTDLVRSRVMGMSPSGEQWAITHDDQSATVVEVGGGLRAYTVAGVDVVAGYHEQQMCSSGRGQLLMPWPNRLRDGRYELDGTVHQLALTEPARGNASHGLVRWSPWRLLDREADELTLGWRLHPQPGWPATLDLTARYELKAEGLRVTLGASNVGNVRVPFGCGAHPYVAIGDTPRAQVELTIPARTQVLVDADRKLPTGTAPVMDGDVDFRSARALGASDLDTAFGDLERDADGRWRVRVAGLVERPPVTVWGDEAFGWLQVYTDKAADGEAGASRRVAVEPLTCPPDAFNSGTDVVMLAPGEHWSGSWGITPER